MKDLQTTCQHVVEYMSRVYDPAAVILYGSAAMGIWRDDSDLDLLVLLKGPYSAPIFPELMMMDYEHFIPMTDTKHVEIDGTDVSYFLRSAKSANGSFILDDLMTVSFYGKILMQHDGAGDHYLKRINTLLHRCLPYTQEMKDESKAEFKINFDSLLADKRYPDFSRKRFVLDSIPAACVSTDCAIISGKCYLRYLKRDDPEAYRLCANAMRRHASMEDLVAWGNYVLDDKIHVDFFNTDFSGLKN